MERNSKENHSTLIFIKFVGWTRYLW